MKIGGGSHKRCKSLDWELKIKTHHKIDLMGTTAFFVFSSPKQNSFEFGTPLDIRIAL